MYKKITPFLFLSLALALSAPAPVTHAQLAIGALVNTSGQLGYDNRDNASSSTRAIATTSIERGNATTSDDRETDSRATTTSASGQLTAQSHRSTVAAFTQSLLALADQEGDLGVQIRTIAEEQRDAGATATEAIEKIASRSSLKTLFLGSDYKNLGILRSEMIQTQNHLAQLDAILARTTDASDRATLTAQIDALALDQADIRAFVTAHEESFSLFGWFVRLL